VKRSGFGQHAPRLIAIVSVLCFLVATLGGCSGGSADGKTTTKTTTKTKPKPKTTRKAAPKTVPRTTLKTVPATTGTVVAVVPVTNLPPTLATVRAKAPFGQFGEVRFTITNAQGKDQEFCALLADTPQNQEQGLMGQNNLAGYDAMLFTWPTDTSSGFWMRTVPIWLSIAWWEGSGKFVNSLDMAPCGDSADCPVYSALRPYRVAMETMRGGLTPLGIKPESILTIGGTCRTS
jgi:uncharacterized membrane protein (UPF0127 family)